MEAVLICCHLPQMLLMHFLSSLHMRCQVLTCESATRHLPCTSASPQKAPSSRLTGSLRRWLLGGAAPHLPSALSSLSLAPFRVAPVPCCAPLPPMHPACPACWGVPSARTRVVGWLILPFFGMSLFGACRCGSNSVPGDDVLAAAPGAQSCCGSQPGRAAEPVHLQHAFAEEKEQLAV